MSYLLRFATFPRLGPASVERISGIAKVGILCVLGISLVIGLPAILLLALSEDAPVAKKYAARSAVQKAREAGSERMAPVVFLAAEQALAEGTREVDTQLRRMRWNRSFGRAEALLDTAIRRADLASTRARQERDEARSRAEDLLTRANAGFDQMEWLSTYIPPRSVIRSDVKRAMVSYTEAKALYGTGDFVRAAEAARRANQGIDAAYGRFARFIQASADPGRARQYDSWVRDTLAWSARHNSRAILVDKMRRSLTLIHDGRRERTYRAELGINGTLDKVISGDRATPEGMYKITEKRGPRQTRWYKALLLNYPNDDDLRRFERARRRGQISRRARPGGLIEIHGEGGRGGDWTDGCVALTNRDMDDLFGRVAVGTPVTIVGFESGPSNGRLASGGAGSSRRPLGLRAPAGAGGR